MTKILAHKGFGWCLIFKISSCMKMALPLKKTFQRANVGIYCLKHLIIGVFNTKKINFGFLPQNLLVV